MKLGPARPVSYMDGIFMGAGQHKGAMLRTLLHKTNRLVKAVVFVDDTPKHCDRMHEAFGSTDVDLVTRETVRGQR
jgi:predicted enzyme involved in methoxymalonyl-ACP biosynthesis